MNKLIYIFMIHFVTIHTQKMETKDLVTFIEEILNGNLHCLCSVSQI